MKSIKIIRGQQYSRKSFEGYKHRAKFQIEVIHQEYYSNLDIYTTETDKTKVFDSVNNLRNKEKVICMKMVNWTTKKQDDMMAELIDETLKGI